MLSGFFSFYHQKCAAQAYLEQREHVEWELARLAIRGKTWKCGPWTWET